MDFNFTEEEQDFRRSVRDWVNAKYPKAKVNELERLEDHDGTNFPHQYFQDLAEAGFLGVGVDESFGGQGGGATEQAILMDELARNLAGLTWVWGIPSFCAKAVAAFGMPTRWGKARSFPGCGRRRGPDGDLGDRAGGRDRSPRRDEDGRRESLCGGWPRISGQKIWSSGGPVPGRLTCFSWPVPSRARSRPSQGVTAFLVENPSWA